MTHPMLQESWDEAAACAQIEHDQSTASNAEIENADAIETEPF